MHQAPSFAFVASRRWVGLGYSCCAPKSLAQIVRWCNARIAAFPTRAIHSINFIGVTTEHVASLSRGSEMKILDCGIMYVFSTEGRFLRVTTASMCSSFFLTGGLNWPHWLKVENIPGEKWWLLSAQYTATSLLAATDCWLHKLNTCPGKGPRHRRSFCIYNRY